MFLFEINNTQVDGSIRLEILVKNKKQKTLSYFYVLSIVAIFFLPFIDGLQITIIQKEECDN